MGKKVNKVVSGKTSVRSRAITPEAREQELANLAIGLAEQKLRDGTASTPLIVHYLKVASRREELEREKLERENELLTARCKSLEQASEAKELFEEVMSAIREYNGEGSNDDDEYDDYEVDDDWY